MAPARSFTAPSAQAHSASAVIAGVRRGALLTLLLSLACATPAPTLQQRAEGGDPSAQIELAEHFENGTPTGPEGDAHPEPDLEQALIWYQRAADQGDPRAELKLAELYYRGEGVSVDYAKAERWARRAAERGYTPAESLMGGL